MLRVARRRTVPGNRAAAASGQVRKQFGRSLTIGDEVVVDEVDGRRRSPTAHHVEFAQNLQRRLQPRLASVECRNVAELAAVGAPAGELDAGQKVAVQWHEVIGRDREVAEWQALAGREADLPPRRFDAVIEQRDEPVRRIAEFADVQVVELRVALGSRGNRRPAQDGKRAGGFGTPLDIADLLRLNVHAADENHVGPGELRRLRPSHVFVDESNVPALREPGGHDQQALRRHEGANPTHQRVGMGKGAERRAVCRKNAENTALVRDRDATPHRLSYLTFSAGRVQIGAWLACRLVLP